MTITTIKPESIKEIRKAMRSLESFHETLLIEGIGQIRKTGKTYAYGPTPDKDDSDSVRDYSAWTYGWKESWILEDIKRNAKIA